MTLINRIAALASTTFIATFATATIAFAKDENIAIETITASKGEHVAEGVIHVQNVNAYISRLKRWMKAFNGVATKYLPNYIGWRRMLEIYDHESLTPKNCLISALC